MNATKLTPKQKFDLIKDQTLYRYLHNDDTNIGTHDHITTALDKISDKKLIELIASKYYFSLQELRQLVEIFVDFNMWEDSSLKEIFRETIKNIFSAENNLNPPSKITSISISISKENFLKIINEKYTQVKTKPKEYQQSNKQIALLPQSITIKPSSIDSGKKIAGMCPVASEKTVCCNLRTIDVIQNCAFACSYCSIQTFYTKNQLMVEQNLDQKLDAIDALMNLRYNPLSFWCWTIFRFIIAWKLQWHFG